MVRRPCIVTESRFTGVTPQSALISGLWRLYIRYGVRTSVRATDVWHSVCAERLITGYKFQKSIGCIQIAKSNRRYIN